MKASVEKSVVNYVGIDVAKAELVVLGRPPRRFYQDMHEALRGALGIQARALVERGAVAATQGVLEAWLAERGFPVTHIDGSLVNHQLVAGSW